MPDPLDPILRDAWFKSPQKVLAALHWERLCLRNADDDHSRDSTLGTRHYSWGVTCIWHLKSRCNMFLIVCPFLRMMELTCSWSDVYKEVFTVIDVVIRVVERTSQGMNLQSSLDISRTLAAKSPTGVPLALWVSRLRLVPKLFHEVVAGWGTNLANVVLLLKSMGVTWLSNESHVHPEACSPACIVRA